MTCDKSKVEAGPARGTLDPRALAQSQFFSLVELHCCDRRAPERAEQSTLPEARRLMPLAFYRARSTALKALPDRDSKWFAQRLRWAKLPQSAALEDLHTRTPRGIDLKLRNLRRLYLDQREAQRADHRPLWCREEFYRHRPCTCRMSRLLSAFISHTTTYRRARHHAQANRSAFLKQIAKVDLLHIDDFGLAPLANQPKRDLLEILKDVTTRNRR